MAYGKLIVGGFGQVVTIGEVTFGTPLLDIIFPPENKFDKVLRLMGVDGKRTFKSTDFKRPGINPFQLTS